MSKTGDKATAGGAGRNPRVIIYDMPGGFCVKADGSNYAVVTFEEESIFRPDGAVEDARWAAWELAARAARRLGLQTFLHFADAGADTVEEEYDAATGQLRDSRRCVRVDELLLHRGERVAFKREVRRAGALVVPKGARAEVTAVEEGIVSVRLDAAGEGGQVVHFDRTKPSAFGRTFLRNVRVLEAAA